MTSIKATLLGIIAIAIWSCFTALMRTITESFGVVAGAALIYTVGAIALCIYNKGIPNIKKFPIRYLLMCGSLFVIYEILLSMAVGSANTRQQSIEVSLVNYLWPCAIVLLSLFINKQKVSLLFWPGIAMSFLGVAWSLSGEQGLNVYQLANNISSDPIPYLLAFIAAFLWGLYCNLSKRYNNGNNGVPLFFICIAVLLWIKFLFGSEKIAQVNAIAVIELLAVGVFIAIAYAFWEIGIQKGNMILLAILSYFTPIASILFSAFWLDTALTLSFWYGVIMVTVGSLLCWLATRINKKSA